MTALTTPPRTVETVTPDQMLDMPEARHSELVDGQLLEKPGMSRESSLITTQLIILMGMFLRDHPLGRVMETQTTYRCFPHKPRQVRRPDVSFVSNEQLSEKSFRGHVIEPPDLAVEVLSPHDVASDIQGRVNDFREAGTPLIWVIDSVNRMARIYREDTIREVDSSGELTGEPVLPGFRCSLAELFAGLPAPLESKDDPDPKRVEDER